MVKSVYSKQILPFWWNIMKTNTCCSCRVTSLNWVKTLVDVMWLQLSSWSIMGNSHSYLGHLGFTVSGEEGEIVDLVLNNEVLLLPLEVLQRQTVLISRGLLISRDALQIKILTWDLHHRMKISATILKSSLESPSGSFSQRDLG